MAVAEKLSEQSEQFSRASLQPLNSRIDEFNAVISPFGYHYSVVANVKPASTDAKQLLRIPGLNEDVECDPPCHLSEGQSAALGLSVLFGAAMEYRWSRWPALLLDDPLQNTDLIHASAFIDVIRGLILDRKYQVIISTHDMEEAEFISRKCMRAGISVTRNDLISTGPAGVRMRTVSGT
jgi:ABC-type nitrate/sulfonate/bicarbonate transport system ATPase subunit